MGPIHADEFGNTDLSLQHLQAELARIDVLIRREVLRWQLAGQDPTDTFRGLYISDDEVGGLLAQSFGDNWGQTVALPAEDADAFARAEALAADHARALVENAKSQGQTPRMIHLQSIFGLDRFALDAFLVCLAPSLDLRYERVYGYLQNDVTRKQPCVNLVLDLLSKPGPQRLLRLPYFGDDAPLARYRLLERVSESSAGKLPLLNQTMVPDETVVAWLLGRYRPHDELGPHARLLWPEVNERDELLAVDVDETLARAAPPTAEGEQPVIAFYGPDRVSQEAAARLCVARMGRPLLAVNLAGVIGADLPPALALGLALRDARLTGAVPYLFGWDACLDKDRIDTLAPNVLPTLCAHPDLVFVAGEKAWQPTGIERRRPLLWLKFEVPAFAQRSALWAHFLGETVFLEEDLDVLAGQFALTSGQIGDSVASARDVAAQENRPMQSSDLLAAARLHSNPRLAMLARKIVPRYDWADIILPDDQLTMLHEIVDTVRGRPLVLEEWGVGKKLASSNGVTVLFSGPPGTGKTMGAEVLASELGLDLYKIDLSTVVSKYIGETEKNLEKIFDEAQSSNAILFFDEADAIFGKRSEVKDAHDRYANVEISYLLQRMEIYDGVAILATNLRANLDEAFTRRLQFAVDFPFPEPQYRLRIWKTLFPEDVPRAREVNFGLLARRFKLAGGNIRNIIVGAAYLAAADGREVTMRHLFHGTRRELQKMGRLVHDADMVVGKEFGEG